MEDTEGKFKIHLLKHTVSKGNPGQGTPDPEKKKELYKEVDGSLAMLDAFKQSGRTDFAAFAKEWKAPTSPATDKSKPKPQ
jgi:hypothetical protein